MSFHLQGRTFFLTYPQCDLTCDELETALRAIRPYQRAVVVREPHKDGHPHLHCAIEYAKRFGTRNARYWDVDGHHPNVQRVRSWGACVNYCRKDGGDQTRYYGCTAEDAVEPSTASGETFDAITECENTPTALEWYSKASQNSLSFAYAECFWRLIHGRQAPTYTDNEIGGVICFQLDVRKWHPANRTICILGPSGCGKTSWALRECPTPFLLVTDIDDLGDYDPTVHKALVFDEIRCTGDENGKGRWPLTSQIKLTTWDTPVSIRIRYKVAHIPAHVPKIFTCCDTYPFTRDTQIMRRVNFINLYPDDDTHRWV